MKCPSQGLPCDPNMIGHGKDTFAGLRNDFDSDLREETGRQRQEKRDVLGARVPPSSGQAY